MKRSGFTMIELIFVIVILGILAAVALPKFIGVAEQAQAGKLKGYVGTLNRTVAPAIWSKSISLGENGSVTTGNAVYNTDLRASLPELEDITDTGGNVGGVLFDLANCTNASVDAINVGDPVPDGNIQNGIIVGGKTYTIGCVNGSQTKAPQFYLSGDGKLLVK